MLVNYLVLSILFFKIQAFSFSWLYDKSVCKFTECCNDDYVPYDITKLKYTLSRKLFGQPLAEEIVNILSAHKYHLNEGTIGNNKALVISLHGWTGVGKNYAVSMIAEAIYQRGVKSSFYKLYILEKDFDCSDIEGSRKRLVKEINNIISKCDRSLIVFDEIHMACPGILDGIRPMLDYHDNLDGISYRNAVFIFISNIGGLNLSKKLLELYDMGLKREEVEFYHFEPILRRVSYNEGGLEKSHIISNHLIDHYIPFLPLEQLHVELCAYDLFNMHGIAFPSQKMIDDALSVITYGPTEDKPIFANVGCKRLRRQIPYVIEKHKIPKVEL